MVKMLEKMGKLAQLCLLGAGLTATLSSGTTVQYAKDDYNQYPKYQGDIALHNIRKIGQQVCEDDFGVNEKGFHCQYTVCTNFVANSMTDSYCRNSSESSISFRWEEVGSVTGGLDYGFGYNNPLHKVTVHKRNGTNESFYPEIKGGNQQRDDLVKAMNVYICNR